MIKDALIALVIVGAWVGVVPVMIGLRVADAIGAVIRRLR